MAPLFARFKQPDRSQRTTHILSETTRLQRPSHQSDRMSSRKDDIRFWLIFTMHTQVPRPLTIIILALQMSEMVILVRSGATEEGEQLGMSEGEISLLPIRRDAVQRLPDT